MIDKKVKAGEIAGVLRAVVGNAAFIEVDENVFKAVNLADVVLAEGLESRHHDRRRERRAVEVPAPVAEAVAEAAAVVKKPRKKRAPKAP